jgi:hypothetical protein
MVKEQLKLGKQKAITFLRVVQQAFFQKKWSRLYLEQSGAAEQAGVF